jgi:hypothetical protein
MEGGPLASTRAEKCQAARFRLIHRQHGPTACVEQVNVPKVIRLAVQAHGNRLSHRFFRKDIAVAMLVWTKPHQLFHRHPEQESSSSMAKDAAAAISK